MAEVTTPCITRSMQCDRPTAFMLFSAIEKKVREALLAIHDIINRSQASKQYPYPAFYKKMLCRSGKDAHSSADGTCETAVNSISRVSAAAHGRASAIRNTIDERISETLSTIKFEQNAQHLDLVRMIVDACVRYQIAVRNLVELMRYLSDAFDRFYKSHIEYDEILQELQCDVTENKYKDNEADDNAVADVQNAPAVVGAAVAKITDVQNNLEISKETLQKFINQVPSQLGKLRIELDLMHIYEVDDTVKVRRFLDSQYVKTLVSQSASPDLKRACRLLRSSWRELLPIDMLTVEKPPLLVDDKNN